MAGGVYKRKPTHAAQAAHLALTSSENSTAASISLLRMLAEDFADGTLAHAAARLAGEAQRPGPREIDDSAALARIAVMQSEGRGGHAVATVARLLAPADPEAQAAIERRLRRKLKENRTQ